MTTDLTKALQRGDLEALRALGCTVSGPVARTDEAPEPKAAKLVEPGIALVSGRLVIMVAVETRNEANQRDWRARSRRSGAAWRAVRESVGVHLSLLEPFARHYASGGALRVTFTRLGGRRLDQMANLGVALKGVEDAVAFLVGADDGDPRWHPVPRQEAGVVGVRVEIEGV